MFDAIIRENTARTRRPLAVALSFAGQVLLVTLAVIAPLLHTETIAPGHLLRIISAPRRLGPVHVFTGRPPAGVYHQSPGLRVFTDHVFRQPAEIPSAILPEMKGPSPDLLAGLVWPRDFRGPERRALWYRNRSGSNPAGRSRRRSRLLPCPSPVLLCV